MWRTYLPYYHPTGCSGLEGGAPAEQYHGHLGELFSYMDVTGVSTQYRKLYFRNEYNFTLDDCRVYFSVLEHSGQLAVATASGYSTGHVESAPGDAGTFVTPTGISGGLEVGSVAPGEYVGVWLRLHVTTGEDPFAYANIAIGGYRS